MGEVRYVYVWGVMIFLIIAQSAVKVPKLRWRSLGVCFLINKTYITHLYLYDKYFSICSVTDMILIVIAAEYLTFFNLDKQVCDFLVILLHLLCN